MTIKTRSIDSRQLQMRIAAYQRPTRWKSIWQLINSFVPFAFLWFLAIRVMSHSIWLTLPIVVLLSAFTIRIFIIFHDCGHQSFFRSKRANTFWGIVTGLVAFTPYHRWKDSHARHHATSGNLDKRGAGDVWMMTRREYLEASAFKRLKYRLYRNPLIMFLLGPLAMLLINNRIPGKRATTSDRYSMHLTNLTLIIFCGSLVYFLGWESILVIQLPTIFLAHVVGVWLFYVQHQFDGVYWKQSSEWDFITASLEGGSFYKLPLILRWVTGSIGYHHLHHLNSRIPNYNLARCHNENTVLHQTKTINLRTSLASVSLRLFDEETGRMIGFREIKRRAVARS